MWGGGGGGGVVHRVSTLQFFTTLPIYAKLCVHVLTGLFHSLTWCRCAKASPTWRRNYPAVQNCDKHSSSATGRCLRSTCTSEPTVIWAEPWKDLELAWICNSVSGGGGCPPGGNGLGQELEQILYLMIGPAIKVSHGHLWNSMSKCWGVRQKEILCYSLVKPQFISVLRSNFEEAVADERMWLVFKENPSALKNQHFSLQESD